MRTARFTCGQWPYYTKQNEMHYCRSLALERKPHTRTRTVFALEYSKQMHLAEASRFSSSSGGAASEDVEERGERTALHSACGDTCVVIIHEEFSNAQNICTVRYRRYMTFFSQGLLLDLAHTEPLNMYIGHFL